MTDQIKDNGSATKETHQTAGSIVAKTWMEILRYVDNNPGVGIAGLCNGIKTLRSQSNSTRLILAGYVQCMMDLGLLTGGRGHGRRGYNLHVQDGRSVSYFTNQIETILGMFHAKHIEDLDKRKKELEALRVRLTQWEESFL
jgi:hypothetical protein